MIILTSLIPRIFHNHYRNTPLTHHVSAPVKPLQVSPQVLGYGITPYELAREQQPVIEVDPDDFEELYHWFLS